ncbi:MAG TPA: hypothetical protein VFK72_08610, partial [Nevskia sp.]|nr:hypothetical protein [Nevskia sp.]
GNRNLGRICAGGTREFRSTGAQSRDGGLIRPLSEQLDRGKISAYSAIAVVSSKVFTVVSFPASTGAVCSPATFLDRPHQKRGNLSSLDRYLLVKGM